MLSVLNSGTELLGIRDCLCSYTQECPQWPCTYHRPERWGAHICTKLRGTWAGGVGAPNQEPFITPEMIGSDLSELISVDGVVLNRKFGCDNRAHKQNLTTFRGMIPHVFLTSLLYDGIPKFRLAEADVAKGRH